MVKQQQTVILTLLFVSLMFIEVKIDETQFKAIQDQSQFAHSEPQERRQVEVEKGGSVSHTVLGKSFGLHTAAPKVDHTSASEKTDRDKHKSNGCSVFLLPLKVLNYHTLKC